MNKQERKLKGYYKFKKRLANHNLLKSMTNPEWKGNLHAFKTTGKPCSCILCSPSKSGEPSPPTVKVYDAIKDSLEEYYDLFDRDCHPRHKRESEALDRIYPYDEDI